MSEDVFLPSEIDLTEIDPGSTEYSFGASQTWVRFEKDFMLFFNTKKKLFKAHRYLNVGDSPKFIFVGNIPYMLSPNSIKEIPSLEYYKNLVLKGEDPFSSL